MKKLMVLALLASFLSIGNTQEQSTKNTGDTGEQVLKTQKDKVSYIIGMDIGTNLKKQSIEVNKDLLYLGIKDAFAGNKGLLTAEETQEVMKNFSQEMQEKQKGLMSKTGEKNKKEGEEFLAKNKTRNDVKTLPSGLQYRVIKEGTGSKPKPDDEVKVNYYGALIDGTEFDSSYKCGQPVTFPVNGVIPGWTEALQLMRVGSKYELFIPSNLAYGERGTGNIIGPNATLFFTVELLSIEKK